MRGISGGLSYPAAGGTTTPVTSGYGVPRGNAYSDSGGGTEHGGGGGGGSSLGTPRRASDGYGGGAGGHGYGGHGVPHDHSGGATGLISGGASGNLGMPPGAVDGHIGGYGRDLGGGHGMPRGDHGGTAGLISGAASDPTWTAADVQDEIEIGVLELEEVHQNGEPEKVREAEMRLLQLRAQLADITARAMRRTKIAAIRARQENRAAQAASLQRRGPPPVQDRGPGPELDPNRKRMAGRAHDSAERHAKKMFVAGQKSNGACQNLHYGGKAGDSIAAAQKKAQRAVRQAAGPNPPPMRDAKKNCSFYGTKAGCSKGAECGYHHSAEIEIKNRSKERGKEQRAGDSDRHPDRMAKDFGGKLFGVVSSWVEDKGYGFIKPDIKGSKGQMFFHRKGTVLQEAIPATTKVEYANGKDKNGKSAAVQVYPLN